MRIKNTAPWNCSTISKISLITDFSWHKALSWCLWHCCVIEPKGVSEMQLQFDALCHLHNTCRQFPILEQYKISAYIFEKPDREDVASICAASAALNTSCAVGQQVVSWYGGIYWGPLNTDRLPPPDGSDIKQLSLDLLWSLKLIYLHSLSIHAFYLPYFCFCPSHIWAPNYN